MPLRGWRKLVGSMPSRWKQGEFFIPAYSENMPAPYIGVKPYLNRDTDFFSLKDAFGWPVDPGEWQTQLLPGKSQIARQLHTGMEALAWGKSSQGITKTKLTQNPAWPDVLQQAAKEGTLLHEKLVCFSTIALSKTQDDKARVRWTLYGSSQMEPEEVFWRSLHQQKSATSFFQQLLATVYGETTKNLHKAGFRILPSQWTKQFGKELKACQLKPKEAIEKVTYLLTFTPFAKLPKAIQQRYLQGQLHLLPFPGSLLLWHAPAYVKLGKALRWANQVPLLHLIDRHESIVGIRVPQSGWIFEPKPGEAESTHHGPFRNTYKTSHRWQRVERDSTHNAFEGKLSKLLFSADPTDTGLYRKPLCRNVQVWSNHYAPILHGPTADLATMTRAGEQVNEGGHFGYRFYWNPMRVGKYELFWHLPIVHYQNPLGDMALFDAESELLSGLLASHRKDKAPGKPEEILFPRFDKASGNGSHFLVSSGDSQEEKLRQSAIRFPGKKLPASFAEAMMKLSEGRTLEEWIASREKKHGKTLSPLLGNDAVTPKPLTYHWSATRDFEERYWEQLVFLTEGKYANKCVADCVTDAATKKAITHSGRDLDSLADHLILQHRVTAAKLGMEKQVLIGDTPFHWKTIFQYPYSDGWSKSQKQPRERNIVIVIPGRDRGRSIIMADHYDTAFMEDYYGYRQEPVSCGARLAAKGADDNHSATASLLLGAEYLMRLSQQGKLGCDVWLVHLTGEEFPSDCMGARYLAQQLVEKRIHLRLQGYHEGKKKDLSKTQLQGLYVLDMIAHNNDNEPDIFQISPGYSKDSLWLAYQAHLANRIWNEHIGTWNSQGGRLKLPRGVRVKEGVTTIPALAPHPKLQGQVRLPQDPRSSLFNTDGQIFSDSGIPCVLFMENYDINRTGYHDRFDTLANIDLDYGAAVAAIAIESVARAATVKPW